MIKLKFVQALFVIFLLMGNAESGLTQAALPSIQEEEAGQRMDLDFYALLERLEQNMPITADTAGRLGFSFDLHTDSRFGPIYSGRQTIQLDEGVRITGTKLAQLKTPDKSGPMFVLLLGGRAIDRQDLEEKYADLEAAPTDLAGDAAARRRLEGFQIRFIFTEKDILREVIFDATQEKVPYEP